ncbi:hypothetical protein DU80_13690 [Methanosarcina mazei]|uniref:Uncharacterized protein n=7 Tax=Methanosarcina mazei TaxID=2209 RepID=A0A0F8JRJ3_METMZ|nr:hypothetical protein MmTuc01_0964 [Methanosarcina mazei Tuc01]AKB39378.1 hypothetical protein MSMAW_0387 [Methanosarcina mazei WWM610]AKB60350.1 hypothetical protein MSMAP_0365 [Methanosarcina mazei SarPi]AKB63562.1 hypothetical protein MSMAS_0366 [Methanosarcina mazei S-6]AKB66920.1 hypothetical protein MSMAL_0377 [Methanosarcina mazei LYC]AKB70274.1 hypothetical protein MSMAC_0384 [Methanosarcina mazei C16]KKF99809.1 hypothetical protein DU47_08040 [Methanosarcina mazei]UWJ21755.1 hypot
MCQRDSSLKSQLRSPVLLGWCRYAGLLENRFSYPNRGNRSRPGREQTHCGQPSLAGSRGGEEISAYWSFRGAAT